ncbi:GNAT family N-acetyltransferase [Flavobacterium sp. MFBS3-15]|uniref:GNAT family N-acetyltransferase n=1 Tax=Flavobacterium sp. MFBS3-15 TaxID=2989816 RepID=UPI0022359CF9|nr:GNAT family N-acetyltransferase [Flavobacterium sp. MFBS3-15]MCW4470773.1 GNAT family N-acetyltransferase [Flavobacterium sp. MFBS3-15]
MPVIETPRLYLRELASGDAECFYLLNADPEVMRFTGDVPFERIYESMVFLEKYSHYKDYGFGRWAVIRKADGQFLGWCGLKYTPDTNEHDIGFRFYRKYWNNGYATEAAKACIKYGFSQLGLTAIIGRAMEANTASVKVLEKAGLVFEKDFEADVKLWLQFKIENEK